MKINNFATKYFPVKRHSYIIYSFALLSMLFWGLSFVWFKIVITIYEPITIIFLRLVISSIFLFCLLAMLHQFQKIKPSDYKSFLILALFQPFFYFLGESYGLKFVSSTISSVIISTIPLFSPLVAYLTIKEKVSRSSLIGIIISFIGLLFMLINKDLSLNASSKGIMLLFFAVFSALGYSVIIKNLAHKYSALTIITYQNTIGAFYFLPLFLIFDFNHFINVVPSFYQISALLQLAIFASSGAYFFYIISIREIGVVRSNIFTNTIPIFTAIFSYFILAEKFGVNKIAGMVIVISGLVVSQIKRY